MNKPTPLHASTICRVNEDNPKNTAHRVPFEDRPNDLKHP